MFLIILTIFFKIWGSKRQINEGLRISFLNQGLNSIKEARIYGKENWFLNKFNYHNKKTFNSLRNYDFVKTLPRFFLEIIVLIFSISVIIIFFDDQPLGEFIPFFGVLFVAFYRAVPILSQLLVSLQSITYAKPSFSLILETLKLKTHNKLNQTEESSINFKETLELKNLSVSYGKDDDFILKNINLKIKKGDRIGIVGESGIGKSTFLDCLMGLIKPTNGSILVDGKNIFSNLREWHKKIGYVPQSIYLIDDTIKKNIAFGEDEQNINMEKINNSLKGAELINFLDKLSKKENSMVGEKGTKISGGEKQRIAIARSLYIDPEIMIFDEATSGLDPDTENKIIDSINKIASDKTIIMVSHKRSSLRHCKKIYEIKEKVLHLI